MMQYDLQEYAQFFKALSDPTRLKIIEQLCGHELCACELLKELDITQPTLSYHMKMLSECGLVHVRKDKSWAYYKINSENVGKLLTFLRMIENKSFTDKGVEV